MMSNLSPECIIYHKKNQFGVFYLVKWKGQNRGCATWVNEEMFLRSKSNAELVEIYKQTLISDNTCQPKSNLLEGNFESPCAVYKREIKRIICHKNTHQGVFYKCKYNDDSSNAATWVAEQNIESANDRLIVKAYKKSLILDRDCRVTSNSSENQNKVVRFNKEAKLIIRHRQECQGTYYLMQWKGHDRNKASWIAERKLKSVNDLKVIKAYKRKFDPESSDEDDEVSLPEKEAELIIQHTMNEEKLMYRVKWRGKHQSNASWVAEKDMKSANNRKVVEAYKRSLIPDENCMSESDSSDDSNLVFRHKKDKKEAEFIIRHYRDSEGLFYLVKWKGYHPNSATWVPARKMTSSNDKKVVNAYTLPLALPKSTQQPKVPPAKCRCQKWPSLA